MLKEAGTSMAHQAQVSFELTARRCFFIPSMLYPVHVLEAKESEHKKRLSCMRGKARRTFNTSGKASNFILAYVSDPSCQGISKSPDLEVKLQDKPLPCFRRLHPGPELLKRSVKLLKKYQTASPPNANSAACQ